MNLTYVMECATSSDQLRDIPYINVDPLQQTAPPSLKPSICMLTTTLALHAKAIVKQFLLGGESSVIRKGLHEPGKQGIYMYILMYLHHILGYSGWPATLMKSTILHAVVCKFLSEMGVHVHLPALPPAMNLACVPATQYKHLQSVPDDSQSLNLCS